MTVLSHMSSGWCVFCSIVRPIFYDVLAVCGLVWPLSVQSCARLSIMDVFFRDFFTLLFIKLDNILS